MALNYFGSTYASSTPSIFVSHSSRDKPRARLIAKALLSMSVNIYFDEMDDCLKRVGTDDVGVVKCIDKGISDSSHLLGLITPNTKDSWWVPYEIGGAMGQRKGCAHLVSSDVDAVPAYIKAGVVIADQDDLAKWVASIKGGTQEALFETVRKSATYGAAVGLDAFLPSIRSSPRFY